MTKSILDNFDLSQIAEPAGAPADVIRQVAAERGINPDHLIGLAKLETRLGDASIKGDGNDTRNLFNIKDFSKSGTGTRALDKAEGSNDRYRQYGSYRESVEDLVGLLERRYPGALKAQDGQQFATALKRGGYATDPDYVQKLAGVIGGAAGGDAAGADWAAGLTDEDLRAAGGFGNSSVMDRVSPSAAKPESGVLDGIKDSAIALEVGLLGGAKSLSDVFGADNAVSKNFDGAAKWVDSFTSPGRQQERQVRQAQIKDAEENGTALDEIVANFGAFADAPMDVMLGAIGSSAPTLLSLLIPGANAATAARLIASGATGMAQGVGAAKGAIFEAVDRKLQEQGVDEDTARKVAAGAQAYDGENAGMLAANGGLGFLAAITGADKSIAKFISGRAGKGAAEKAADGLAKSMAKGVAKEAPLESAQGGFERVTSNVALQNEGFDTPAFQGAAGQATLEGLASSGLGAAGGLMDRSAPVVNPLVKQLDDQIAKGNSPLSRATVAATPELKVDPITQRVGEVEAAFREGGLLDKLGAMDQGALTRQEFLEALSIARNPSQPAAYRAQALESVEQAMTWLAEGRMPNVPGTGTPFSTALTTTEQPGTDLATQAGDALTKPGAPEFFDANTVDGEVVRTDNMLDGPRALPVPPGQPLATQTQPADAGFFAPGDAASVADPAAEEKPQNQLQGQKESLQVATDSLANAVPVARKQVTAPKAVALPESGDNPGTAQTRKRKVQLEAMAATGFGAVERRPDGFFLVNEAAQEEMRLDGPGDAQLARAAIARSTPVVGSAINQTWTAFHPESGTLNIPRAEMPQIKSEHRGAMVNFLAARGIKGTQRIEPATDLKPTQAEFSQSKVDQAKAFQGNDRPVLVSSDGHVLDGHHQWLAKMQQQAPVKVMRLSAPIAQLLAVMQEFPSAGMTKAPTTLSPLTGDGNGQDSGAAGAGVGGQQYSDPGLRPQNGPRVSDENIPARGGRDTTAGAASIGGSENSEQQGVDDGVAQNESLLSQSRLRIEENRRVLKKRLAKVKSPQEAFYYQKQLRKSPELSTPPKAETEAFLALKTIWGKAFGDAPVVAFYDDRNSAVDGFEQYGVTHINLANPQMAVQWTMGHEYEHATEKNQTPAQARFRELIWSELTTEGKREFYEGFLGNGPDSYDLAMANPQAYIPQLDTLKKEMLAEFMGARFTDKAWLQKLAKQKPNLFGEFIKDWLPMLDGMIQSLKSVIGLGKDSQKNVDKYIKDLEKAKATALELAISWAEANQKLAQSTGADQAVSQAQANDINYSKRGDAEQEYRDVVSGFKNSDSWLKAPNGKPTLLNERQWVQVRTPQFKKWFGDWEYFAANGGVWADDDGKVSKAVDANGEPLVVYHGTDKGGFMSFNQPIGSRRGNLGIFTTDNRDMARSYVRKGRPQDLTPATDAERLAELDILIEDFEGRTSSKDTEDRTLYQYTTPFGDETGPFETEADAMRDALAEWGDGSNETKAGIYAAFINLRNPNEDNFEGAMWNGDRSEQWTVVVDYEVMTLPDGRQYLNEAEARALAKTFADPNDEYEGADYMVAADDRYETTDDVVQQGRRDGHDSTIIREVVDDGGGPGYDMTPSDVFVAFEPNQLKSADFNTGEFGESDDIRYSQRMQDFFDAAERTEVSTTVPYAKKNGELVSDAVAQKWIIDAKDIVENGKHLASAVAAIKSYNAVDFAGDPDVVKALHTTVVDNLVWLHNLMPADIRARAKLWYDGANRIAAGLAQRHGIDERQAAGVLAVLSPQKDWFMNTSLGERAMVIMRSHGSEAWSPAMTNWVKSYVSASKTVKEREQRSALLAVARRSQGVKLSDLNDGDAARFVRVFDETYFPRRYRVVTPEGGFGEFVTTGSPEIDQAAEEVADGSVAWGDYGTIEKTVTILRDNNPRTLFATISGALGGEHKVRNFYNNIIRPNSADGHVTIDTHAVAAALFKALSGASLEVSHNFGTTPKGVPGAGGNANSGASGLYGLFADAYRDAASQLGLLPRELQSITWEAIRSIFLPKFKSKRAGDVDALFNRHLAGELTREQARDLAYDMGGGFKKLPWEGTPQGHFVQDGGSSFESKIAKEPRNRVQRLMQPMDAKDSITLSLSAATNSIPGVAELYRLANQGDALAHGLLQDVAIDNLRHLLQGTSAVIKATPVTGLFEKSVEPSLGVMLTFGDSDRAKVLAAIAKFADNFNQKQVHVRQGTTAPAGTAFDDGSYATPVYRWALSEALDRKQIQKIIDKSGLYGLTFGEDFIEAYLVGDPNDKSGRDNFHAAIERADSYLGKRATSSGRTVARLWPYGDGAGAIGYDTIRGDLTPGQATYSVTARRVAAYLNAADGKPGRVKAFEQEAQISPEQDALQTKIAGIYESLPDNDLKNPRVRKAYTELAREVLRQYKALPVKVEILSGQGEPYANSGEMRRDVLDNNHLFIFGTTPDTFGPVGADFTGHPLLEDSGLRDQGGATLLFNDLLRAVHDYYAHTMAPTQFGPKGEEAAWKNHMAMTRNTWARWALTIETRGQNSWVNFNSQLDRSSAIKDRDFARQKAALLPVEYSLTGNAQVDKPMKAFIESLPEGQRLGSKPQYSSRIEEESNANTTRRPDEPNRPGGYRDPANADLEQGASGAVAGGANQLSGRSAPGGAARVQGAIHFGQQAGLSSLSGGKSGTGIKGLERDRLKESDDERIKRRVYFYLPVAGGLPQPEAGLGGVVYRADLDGLYEISSSAIPGDGNAFESAVLDAGYRGFINREQGTIVVLNDDVEVTAMGGIGDHKLVPRLNARILPPTQTTTQDNKVVRKPTEDELTELASPARRSAVRALAPSFQLQYGSFRVGQAEAVAANMAIREFSPTFKFEAMPAVQEMSLRDRRAVLQELLACMS